MKEQDLTDYIFESEISKALTEAQSDFTAAGVPLSARPTASELLERLKRLAQRPNALIYPRINNPICLPGRIMYCERYATCICQRQSANRAVTAPTS